MICSRLHSTFGSVGRVVAMNYVPLRCGLCCLWMPYLSAGEPELSPCYSIFLKESNWPLGGKVATLGLSWKGQWFIFTGLDTYSARLLCLQNFSQYHSLGTHRMPDPQTEIQPGIWLCSTRGVGVGHDRRIHWSYHIPHCLPSTRSWPQRALEWSSEGMPETLA